MEKVLVTGGTGNLGRQITGDLLQRNYDVSVLSSRPGAQTIAGATVVTGDLISGQGLQSATSNANFIIHCASDPRNPQEVDIKGIHNLLQSIDVQRMKHIIYISIVGVDKSAYPYYKIKFEVERSIANSAIPYTILRTTQFHSFVFQILQGFLTNSNGPVVTIPAGMRFQSVDIADVSRQLVAHLHSPSGLLSDLGGPEILEFEKMAAQYAESTGTSSIFQPAQLTGERFELFRSGVNLCPENKDGKITWKCFLDNMPRSTTVMK